jgi:mRNA interferase RelE/StbE
MLKIEFQRAATKAMQRLPPKHRKQVARKIYGLRENPAPQDSKKLKGTSSAYRRADIGEYRIIYRVDDDTLRVFLVGKRNDMSVYRQFTRMLRG